MSYLEKEVDFSFHLGNEEDVLSSGSNLRVSLPKIFNHNENDLSKCGENKNIDPKENSIEEEEKDYNVKSENSSQNIFSIKDDNEHNHLKDIVKNL